MIVLNKSGLTVVYHSVADDLPLVPEIVAVLRNAKYTGNYEEAFSTR